MRKYSKTYHWHKPAIGFLKSTLAFMFLLGTIGLGSCDRTRHNKGYEYFPDMAHSLAYETYADNPNFTDGKTMRTPPEGTIPRGYVPYPFPATPEGRDQAALELINPLEANPEVLKEGKELYQVFCQQCHGGLGDGKGVLYTSGKFTIPPPSLIREEYLAKSPGDMYHVITQGWGVMGAHGAQIKSEDRWKIVSYVETVLQGK